MDLHGDASAELLFEAAEHPGGHAVRGFGRGQDDFSVEGVGEDGGEEVAHLFSGGNSLLCEFCGACAFGDDNSFKDNLRGSVSFFYCHSPSLPLLDDDSTTFRVRAGYQEFGNKRYLGAVRRRGYELFHRMYELFR